MKFFIIKKIVIKKVDNIIYSKYFRLNLCNYIKNKIIFVINKNNKYKKKYSIKTIKQFNKEKLYLK